MVVDACVVITFGNADALDVITRLRRHEVGVCPRVVDEVTKPPAAEALRDAVNQGIVGQLSLDLTDATERSNLQRFDSRPAFRNRADAEVLALAISRSYIVGSDETAVRRAAAEELGWEMVAGTLDFLVWAVRERRVALAQAEVLLETLDVGPSIIETLARSSKTFGDLLN